MRATEILEQAQASSKLIASTKTAWAWQITPELYTAWAGQLHRQQPGSSTTVPPGTDRIFWLGPTTKWSHPGDFTPDVLNDLKHVFSHETLMLAQQGTTLTVMVGSYDPPIALMKKLVSSQGVQTLADPLNLISWQIKYTVYKGNVIKRTDLMQTLQVATLSDGSVVYEIDPALRSALSLTNPINWHKQYTNVTVPVSSWDTLYQIRTSLVGMVRAAVLDGHIIAVTFESPQKSAVNRRIIEELAQLKNLTIDVELPQDPATAKKQFVKPNSNFHKMLAYVKDNPGATRSDWYVKHLGNDPQGMPSWTSAQSVDNRAATLGLIVNKGSGLKYSLHITPRGSIALAMLNAGKPFPLHVLKS